MNFNWNSYFFHFIGRPEVFSRDLQEKKTTTGQKIRFWLCLDSMKSHSVSVLFVHWIQELSKVFFSKKKNDFSELRIFPTTALTNGTDYVKERQLDRVEFEWRQY